MPKRIAHILIAMLLYPWVSLGNGADSSDIEKHIIAKLDSGTFYTNNNRPELALTTGLECLPYLEEISGNSELQKRVLAHVSHTLNRLHRPELAIPYLEQILEIEAKVTPEYSNLYNYTLGSLGSHYFTIGDTINSFKAYKYAADSSIHLNDQIYHASSINNLGIFYERTERYDSALIFFNKAISAIPWGERYDSSLFASIRDNIAGVYNMTNNKESAIDLLTQNLKYARQHSDERKRCVKTSLKLAEIYMQLGNTSPVEVLLEQAEQFVDDKNEFEYLKSKTAIEEVWVKYSEIIGSSQLQIFHQQQLTKFLSRQLELAQNHEQKIDRILADYTVKKVNRELKRRSEMLSLAKREAETNRYLLIILSCFSAFILFTTYYFYNRRIVHHRLQTQLRAKELENKELLNRKLKDDLTHKERDFSNLIMQVSLKEGWAKDLAEKVNALIKGKHTIETIELKKLVIELKQQSGIHDKLDLFQSGMEEVNTKFFAVLESKFPNLTRSEKEVCGLIRLNLSGKEIATIRNINPTSVRKMRQRIRKKIGISEDVDLYQFIQELQ